MDILMKTLQILSLMALSITWASYLFFGRSKWQPYLPAAAALVTAAQLVVEGFSIEMLLVYILVAALFLISLPRLFRPSSNAAARAGTWRRVLKITGFVFGTVLVLASIGIPILFPASPEPTGSYKVGITSFEWVDLSRPETFTSDPDDHRDLMVTVWYPASISSPDAQDVYPVLVFSHGWGMSVGAYDVQLSDIASHGYVIFGIDHPYEAAEVRYPDGRLVALSPDTLDSLRSDRQKEANLVLEQYKAATDPAEKERLSRLMDQLNQTLAESSLTTWTDDTIFVLNQIEKLVRDGAASIFSDHLDLSEIGVFGHSFGGAIAGMTCLNDLRCKAGLNMDGMQFGQYEYTANGSLHQPFMEMTSEDIPAGVNDFMYNRTDNRAYRLRILGARHNNFTDMPMFVPLLRQSDLIGGGPIDPFRMKTIVVSYTLAFFDQYLMGIDSPLLTAPSPAFPEVTFQIVGR